MKKEAIPRFFFVYAGYLYLVLSLGFLTMNALFQQLFFTRLVYHTMIFGFIAMLIFGMSYNLIPIFSRRVKWYSNKMIIAHLLVANLALIVMMMRYLLPPTPSTAILHVIFAILWLIGVLLYNANIILTVRMPAHSYKTKVRVNTIKLDKIASRFTIFSGIYVTIGALTLALEDIFIPFPVVVHWHTTGFIMLMIIGTGYHVFPRITRVQIPYKVAFLSLPGIIAPLLLTLSQMNPWSSQLLFLIGALLEYMAVLSFACALTYMVVKAPKKRFVMAYYFMSAMSMIIGLGIGVSFGLYPDLVTELLQVHAFINLFGIVTFLIFGVSFQMIFFYPTLPNTVKKFAQVFIFLAFLLGMILSIGSYLTNNYLTLAGGLLLMLIASIIGAVGLTLSPILIKLKLIRLEKEAELMIR